MMNENARRMDKNMKHITAPYNLCEMSFAPINYDETNFIKQTQPMIVKNFKRFH